MTVRRYKAKQVHGTDWDMLDLAADGKVVLCRVPAHVVLDVVEALNAAYDTGVADGTASERIGNAGRYQGDGYDQHIEHEDGNPRNNDPDNLRVVDATEAPESAEPGWPSVR